MQFTQHLERPASTASYSQRLKICLAGSGGGHVRQLLDLQPVWSQHDYFFVTEDTALGRTLSGEHRTHFVPHFAWGQIRLGSPFRMMARALSSLVRSAGILIRERPDIVISTGAGAVIFAVLWGRALGARIIVLESFARFEKPSLFGRLAAPLAHHMIVQSSRLSARYPKARVFDPFRIVEGDPPAKARLLFATVGATLPFDRLVRAVETLHSEGAISDRVVAQVGEGGHRPPDMETHEALPFGEVQAMLREARVVVCHGGTGSLITALRQGCHVIAMPRLADRGEHYDNHQAEITEAFASRGLIQVANSVGELRDAIARTEERTPVLATTDPAELMRFLAGVIEQTSPRRTK